MIVFFISQCQKNAIKKTCRVLDSFADRIGDRTWRTIITQEGLLAVKKLLKKTASKNTAVACHLVRGRNSMEVLWIVGRRNCFNPDGKIPISKTKQNVLKVAWENDWHFHPLVQSLSALAALFHDVGKACQSFQEKLLQPNKRISDPLRHEWISALIIVAIIKQSGSTDTEWLSFLAKGIFDSDTIKSSLLQIKDEPRPFAGLPNFAFMIVWLILSHHRLPSYMEGKQWQGSLNSFPESFKEIIKQDWGYWNLEPTHSCFSFPNGLPFNSKNWIMKIQKWATKASTHLSLFEQAVAINSIRPILYYSRLCLMFGDHLFSSMDADARWPKNLELYANTYTNGNLKQRLDEHLLGVEREALSIAHLLPQFEHDLDCVKDVRALKRRALTNSPFYWQDKAVDKVINWKQNIFGEDTSPKYGLFTVNMASTGYGKTFANAKLVRALSKDGDSLRFVLALGLRTLTLQTGDEYRDRIGLDDTELAILIGSKAVENLHRQTTLEEGSESTEPLLEGDIIYESTIPESKLSIILKDEKARKLLYSPVLVCTIDYMMVASETVRGGRWMLPFLRLMSSDLVIDEIDDFSGSDLIAIGRLIHMAGMLGRKVIISSATIPPDLAEGYFRVYLDGWTMYAKSRNLKSKIGCGWVDEFNTKVVTNSGISIDEACQIYQKNHNDFITKRAKKILENEQKHGVRRKGYIVPCPELFAKESLIERKAVYFDSIRKELIHLHHLHSYSDPNTGIKVSFGCIRVAHIKSCIELSEYLLRADYPEDFDVRVLAYHSRQVLLLRSEQEKHLDAVLKCKDQSRSQAFSNDIIRVHLDQSKLKHMTFLLVCTPVEEVGRDHDFDWAIVEPSSFRSLIQLAGRIRRHRKGAVYSPNFSIMQYNLRSLDDQWQGPVFSKPGFETNQCLLDTHDITQLVDEKIISQAINAIPRISKNSPLNYSNSLIDLEHHTMELLLTSYAQSGPESIGGWLGNSGWWMSALPQRLAPFRSISQPLQRLIYSYNGEDPPIFGVYDKTFIPQELSLNIKQEEIPQKLNERLWLIRSYPTLLEHIIENIGGESLFSASLKYGEIQIPEGSGFVYSDQFGMKKD
ncbi:MAG: type I-F CRISPR-associated helicase Cas3f [Sphaerochaetaceae bacterium]